MPDKIFNDVKFTAEQVTEIHRTLENDHTVTEVELPGVVNIYLEIEGGRLLFTQYKAGKVLDAIDAAAKAQKQGGQRSALQARQPVEPPAEPVEPPAEPVEPTEDTEPPADQPHATG